MPQANAGAPLAGVSMPHSSPPLDTIAADAEKLAGGIALSIPDPGQIWITLPDGALPSPEGAPTSIAAMKQPEKRHAVLLARQVFLRKGLCVLNADQRRVMVEFQPAMLAGRTKDGQAFAKADASLSLSAATPEIERSAAPDLGALLQSVQNSTKSLEAIDGLLDDPSALSSTDEPTRAAAREKLAEAKDKALNGLGALSSILAEGDGGDRDRWLARVAEASGTMVEHMADLDGLPEGIKAGKLKALAEFKATVARYFATIDPNSPVAQRFSVSISKLVLKERREVAQSKKSVAEKQLEETYSALISVLQSAMPKGVNMSLLPLPRIEAAHGYWGKIVFNMCHLMMAVQNGGFHMRLEIDPRNKRAWNECRGWEDRNPPQVHIVSQSEANRNNARSRQETPTGGIDPNDLFP